MVGRAGATLSIFSAICASPCNNSTQVSHVPAGIEKMYQFAPLPGLASGATSSSSLKRKRTNGFYGKNERIADDRKSTA
jgi:hypothetical protein